MQTGVIKNILKSLMMRIMILSLDESNNRLP